MFCAKRYRLSMDESRQQKAMLLLEHKEAVDELAGLREQAIRLGRDIEQFGKWLSTDPTRKIYTGTQQQYGLPTDSLDVKYERAVDFQEALALADAMRAATAKVKDLEFRKRDLNL